MGGGITYQQSCEEYNEIIRNVAAEEGEGVYLIDIEKGFYQHVNSSSVQPKDETINSLLLPDLVHLSKSGHKLYFDIFIKGFLMIINDFMG